MTHDGSAGALRALVDRVRRNVIVSVTVGSQGQKTSVAPFLTGTIRLADAVPRLASRTGAVVLPVFTVRTPDGRFVTTVEPALEAPDGQRPSLTHQMAARLESWVRRYPGQFTIWEDVTAGSADSAAHQNTVEG
jgi:lauroyl/myristoyl acyltransferase